MVRCMLHTGSCALKRRACCPSYRELSERPPLVQRSYRIEHPPTEDIPLALRLPLIGELSNWAHRSLTKKGCRMPNQLTWVIVAWNMCPHPNMDDIELSLKGFWDIFKRIEITKRDIRGPVFFGRVMSIRDIISENLSTLGKLCGYFKSPDPVSKLLGRQWVEWGEEE